LRIHTRADKTAAHILLARATAYRICCRLMLPFQPCHTNRVRNPALCNGIGNWSTIAAA